MKTSLLLIACSVIGLFGTLSADAANLTSASIGAWTRIDLPAEDVRYVEALSGENVLFWRGTGSALRRAEYTVAGSTVTLGTITSPTGLTSGDHASILNLGGGNLVGYFHPGSPSSPTQNVATSSDGGNTWTGEAAVNFPFPSPTAASDSGTTGGGGIYETGGERRYYAQNNFADIVLFTSDAGSATSNLANGDLLINGNTGNFQNQSPSGDVVELPFGDVLYFYTDGEGSETTQGAVGVLTLNASGNGFTSQLDNVVQVDDAGLVAAGMTSLDEMTVNNFSAVGNQVSFLMFLSGDSVANGSTEDIFYAPVTLTFDAPVAAAVPEPKAWALAGIGLLGLMAWAYRRRRRA